MSRRAHVPDGFVVIPRDITGAQLADALDAPIPPLLANAAARQHAKICDALVQNTGGVTDVAGIAYVVTSNRDENRMFLAIAGNGIPPKVQWVRDPLQGLLFEDGISAAQFAQFCAGLGLIDTFPNNMIPVEVVTYDEDDLDTLENDMARHGVRVDVEPSMPSLSQYVERALKAAAGIQTTDVAKGLPSDLDALGDALSGALGAHTAFKAILDLSVAHGDISRKNADGIKETIDVSIRTARERFMRAPATAVVRMFIQICDRSLEGV